MTMLNLLAVGSPVWVGAEDDRIEGEVTAITIMAGDHVRYEVAWWSARTRNCVWLEESEVSPASKAKRREVGFLESA